MEPSTSGFHKWLTLWPGLLLWKWWTRILSGYSCFNIIKWPCPLWTYLWLTCDFGSGGTDKLSWSLGLVVVPVWPYFTMFPLQCWHVEGFQSLLEFLFDVDGSNSAQHQTLRTSSFVVLLHQHSNVLALQRPRQSSDRKYMAGDCNDMSGVVLLGSSSSVNS